MTGYCAFCGAGPREASECEDVRCDIRPVAPVREASACAHDFSSSGMPAGMQACLRCGEIERD